MNQQKNPRGIYVLFRYVLSGSIFFVIFARSKETLENLLARYKVYSQKQTLHLWRNKLRIPEMNFEISFLSVLL